MQTLINIDKLVDTDVVLEARFKSRLITLEDVEALFHLLNEFVEAAQQEINNSIDADIILIPEVAISAGSAKGRVKVKANGGRWDSGTKQAVAAIMAAIITLVPGTISGSKGDPKPLDDYCAQKVIQAVQDTNANWRKLSKGFTASFEMKCGNVNATSKIEWPDKKQKG